MSLSLQQSENYCSSLQATEHECFRQYARIIKDYWVEFGEKIAFQDEKRKRYIMIKGVESIAHIFIISLMYSNNLEMAVESAQKGQMCFLEFISQMGEDSSLLNIGLIDAILFTYRKTIFDIPVEIKKEFSQCDFIIPYVRAYIDIHNTALSGIINYPTDGTSRANDKLTNTMDAFELTKESLLQLPLLYPHLDVIALVTERLSSYLPPVAYLCTLAQFVKQIQRQVTKNMPNLKEMEKKFLMADEAGLTSMQSGKIVKWLLQRV